MEGVVAVCGRAADVMTSRGEQKDRIGWVASRLELDGRINTSYEPVFILTPHPPKSGSDGEL